MRRLLEKQTQRIINILELLTFEHEWCTILELSQAVGTSARTTTNDIMIIRKKWGDMLDIEASNKYGIRINNRYSTLLGKILLELFQSSEALLLLESVFVHPFKNKEFHAQKLFVSESTLERYISRINKVLVDYGLVIRESRKALFIVSKDEIRVRKFFSFFFIELYGLKSVPFSFPARELMAVLINDLGFFTNNEIVMYYQVTLYGIGLIREQQGFLSVGVGPINPAISVNQQTKELVNRYFPNVSEQQMQNIHSLLARHFNCWEDEEEKKRVTQQIATHFDSIFDAMNFELDPKNRAMIHTIICGFYFNYKIHPFPFLTLHNRIDYFALAFKQDNLWAYQVIEEQVRKFSLALDREMAFMTNWIVFWMSTYFHGLNWATANLSILLVVDLGKKYAEFIQKTLMRFLNPSHREYVSVDIAHFWDSYHPYADYDLVVTNIVNLPTDNVPQVLINDYPTDHDVHIIKNNLVRITNLKKPDII